MSNLKLSDVDCIITQIETEESVDELNRINKKYEDIINSGILGGDAIEDIRTIKTIIENRLTTLLKQGTKGN